MPILTPSNYELFCQNIQKAFQKAAEVLKKILSEDIVIKNQTGYIQVKKMPSQIDLYDTLTNFHVLQTKISGEITGESFLFISENHADRIWQSKLAASLQTEDLKIPFLKEIDNIFIASWLTIFSDYYSVDVFGEAPTHHKWLTTVINEQFLKVIKNNVPYLTIFNSFKTQHSDILIDIIFVFNDLSKLAIYMSDTQDIYKTQ